MSSWEIAVIVGTGFLPFFLDSQVARFEEKLKDEKVGWLRFGIFFLNMSLFLLVLRLGEIIAKINSDNASSIMNGIFSAWLTLLVILFLAFVFVYVPIKLFRKEKEERSDG